MGRHKSLLNTPAMDDFLFTAPIIHHILIIKQSWILRVIESIKQNFLLHMLLRSFSVLLPEP